MIRYARSNDDVRAALPDCDLEYLPTAQQFNLFRGWVRWDLGCDMDGRFLGWCPLHDSDQEAFSESNVAGAGYNFSRGTFHCDNESCHPNKRGMTLGQLVERVAERVLVDG